MNIQACNFFNWNEILVKNWICRLYIRSNKINFRKKNVSKIMLWLVALPCSFQLEAIPDLTWLALPFNPLPYRKHLWWSELQEKFVADSWYQRRQWAWLWPSTCSFKLFCFCDRMMVCVIQHFGVMSQRLFSKTIFHSKLSHCQKTLGLFECSEKGLHKQ